MKLGQSPLKENCPKAFVVLFFRQKSSYKRAAVRRLKSLCELIALPYQSKLFFPCCIQSVNIGLCPFVANIFLICVFVPKGFVSVVCKLLIVCAFLLHPAFKFISLPKFELVGRLASRCQVGSYFHITVCRIWGSVGSIVCARQLSYPYSKYISQQGRSQIYSGYTNPLHLSVALPLTR